LSPRAGAMREENPMTIRTTVASAAILAATACGPSGPTSSASNRVAHVRDGSTPTLLVTNATCNPGPCVPFEVRGFVPKFNVPGQPPEGFVRLGSVTARSSCLPFPASWTVTIRGPSDTTAITWTIGEPISLSAVASRLEVLGSTSEFVPTSSAGWSITFPSAQGAAMLSPSQPCVP